MIQFLKWRKDIGEYKIKDRLAPYYEIYQFGRKAWLGKRKTTTKFFGKKFEVKNLEDEDKRLAMKGLEFAKKVVKEKKPHLLILDEINLVVYWKLLDVNHVIEFLDNLPQKVDVVLTGRYASKQLIEKADFVNITEDVKAPKKFKLTKGIQY